ncbi:MAG TPA: type II toxin-antitoxin system RelE/ParE family toxin [Patescibacteria group bacterium]|nr:type II toxin-antitoxin system RelE/ParE family toxin [Patescibacteria group bacterium]
MSILWLAAAERDLDSLVDYIAEDNPRTALQIFTTIRKSIKKLELYPAAGREGRVEQTRELVITHLPYIIVYRIAKEIQILAVVHTSRKWPATFTES